jgi:hypothetical protein
MKILAHPLSNGEYIVYLMDDTGKPLSAELRKTKEDILLISSKMSVDNGGIEAEYIDDFSADSKKPRWKILSH